MGHFKDFLDGLQEEGLEFVAKLSGKPIERSKWASVIADHSKSGLQLQLGIKYVFISSSRPLLPLR